MRIFGQAHKAAEYCAAFLGTVTHRANHHSIEVVRSDGTIGHKIARDSAPGDRPGRGVKRSANVAGLSKTLPTPPHAPDPPQVSAESVGLWGPRVKSTFACAAAKSRAAHKAAVRSEAQRGMDYWRENRENRPAPAPPSVTAEDRLSALRRRVLGTT
jgi:hypothetical protein